MRERCLVEALVLGVCIHCILIQCRFCSAVLESGVISRLMDVNIPVSRGFKPALHCYIDHRESIDGALFRSDLASAYKHAIKRAWLLLIRA